jgi:putative transposase
VPARITKGSAMYPQRKRIRLQRDLYQQPTSLISITISVAGGQSVFADPSLASDCVRLLGVRAEAMHITVIAYCFMPDHLHLLLNVDEGGDVVDFIQDFKGRSTRLFWRHNHHGRVWQRSFYDHILRENDDPMKHIRYIIDNPVRAGIVESHYEYPWCGSFEYDLADPEFWEV